MVAETLTVSPIPVGAAHGLAKNLKIFYSKYEIAANVEDGDIFELGYLPKNVMVVGAVLVADDIDTGTEALDMDLGWAANGGGSATYYDTESGITYTNSGASASATGFINGGVLTGDGIAELHTGNQRIQFFVEPKYFSEKTMVQIEANVAANAFAAGGAAAYIIYYAV
ncbi:MAG: hypothetical protein BVN33_14595 [Proteobacteria bacterium ST_bin13]|nr:MAG: hypothetical protein BVN33_14595 [Proteobacteria bacterium ST_bin13]